MATKTTPKGPLQGKTKKPVAKAKKKAFKKTAKKKVVKKAVKKIVSAKKKQRVAKKATKKKPAKKTVPKKRVPKKPSKKKVANKKAVPKKKKRAAKKQARRKTSRTKSVAKASITNEEINTLIDEIFEDEGATQSVSSSEIEAILDEVFSESEDDKEIDELVDMLFPAIDKQEKEVLYPTTALFQSVECKPQEEGAPTDDLEETSATEEESSYSFTDARSLARRNLLAYLSLGATAIVILAFWWQTTNSFIQIKTTSIAGEGSLGELIQEAVETGVELKKEVAGIKQTAEENIEALKKQQAAAAALERAKHQEALDQFNHILLKQLEAAAE